MTKSPFGCTTLLRACKLTLHGEVLSIQLAIEPFAAVCASHATYGIAMKLFKFACLVLFLPIPLFLIHLLLRSIGYCQSNPYVTGECELIGLSFPWGFVISVPAAAVLLFAGAIANLFKTWSK